MNKSSVVQVRLDPETRKILDRLTMQMGRSASDVIREALHTLGACYPKASGRKFIGQGEFSFGPGDLATNKAHMEGFGEWQRKRRRSDESRRSDRHERKLC